MAGSQQYSVTSGAPVLLASAPPQVLAGQCGWAFVSNGSGGKIWLGGPNVSAANGAGLAASTTLPVPLFPGDALYAIADASTSVVGVLQTGT